MKKKHPSLIIFSIMYAVILTAIIISLCLGKYGVTMLCGVPSVFLVPIYLTFLKIPENTNRHAMKLILLILARYALSIIALLLPTLLWYYIPSLKESANAFFLLIPCLEVVLVYNIVAISSVVESKKQITRMKEKA